MHWPQAHSILPGCRHSLRRGERNNSGLKPKAAGSCILAGGGGSPSPAVIAALQQLLPPKRKVIEQLSVTFVSGFAHELRSMLESRPDLQSGELIGRLSQQIDLQEAQIWQLQSALTEANATIKRLSESMR
jgi:hypothetical protein